MGIRPRSDIVNDHDNDHDMRDAYQRSLTKRDTGADAAQEPALPLDRLDALAHGTGTESERLRTLDLAMSSAQGRREFEIAWAAARAAAPKKSRAYSTRWMGIAAALLVSTGGAAYWTSQQRSSLRDEAMRGTESPVQLVEPRGGIAALPGTRFTWRAVQSARSYTIVLVDRRGKELFASSTGDTTITLPKAVALEAGESYLWWVQAELADGSTLSAVTESITVRPR